MGRETTRFQVAGIGEVLWDLLPEGRQLGGAPANFAYHAHSLGAQAHVISRVGDDADGRAILCRFEELGLSGADLQVDPSAPTGTVTVAVRGEGIPEYTIHEGVAWDRISVTPDAQALVRGCDVVCFGSLAQREETSRKAVQQLLASAPQAAWRIFDINLRQHFYGRDVIARSLELANVLKLNDAELPIVSAMLGVPGSAEQQIEELAARYQLEVVALTLGAKGSLLFRANQWSSCGGQPVEVRDTVGAGDAFTAALAMGLLKGMDLDAVHEAAAEVARFVCSCPGGTPRLPDTLRDRFAV